MKSDVIAVSSREDRTELALDLAERTAAYHGLSHKSALHLRLLTEEMMGLMRAVTGALEGEFWIESRDSAFELHLRGNAVMNEKKRKQLLSAATSGKNEAERGFMGKLRAFFEPSDTAPVFYGAGLDGGEFSGAIWSLCAYQSQLKSELDRKAPGAEAAWDELEKSVVAHLADDVKVSIRGGDVELTIFKTLH